MNTSLDLFFYFIFLTCYCYSFTERPFLLEKANRKMPVPVLIDKKLHLKEIKEWRNVNG